MGARGSTVAWALASAAVAAMLAGPTSARPSADIYEISSAPAPRQAPAPLASIAQAPLPITCGRNTTIPAAKIGTCRADAQRALDRHNAARVRYGAPPLLWSRILSRYALNNVTRTCKFQHSGGPYGENLARGSGLTCSQAVDLWVQEESKWPPPGGPDFTYQTGHFTQVVWKATQQVGCAITACGNVNLVACEYTPPGNVLGQFGTQVGARGSRPPCLPIK